MLNESTYNSHVPILNNGGPGEKLFEELLTAEEGTTATKHDRIYVGKPSNFSMDKLFVKLKELEQIVTKPIDDSQGKTIREILKTLVPTAQWQQKENKVDAPDEQGEHRKVIVSKAAVNWIEKNG